MKNALLTFLVVCPTIFLATEKAKEIKDAPAAITPTEGMTVIRKWEDVSPFAGQVVAYKATHYHLTRGEDGYPIAQDESLRAGYIDESVSQGGYDPFVGRESGYDLKIFLKKGALAGLPAFNNFYITRNQGPILMRQTTTQERNMLLQALSQGNARLGLVWGCTEKKIMESLQK